MFDPKKLGEEADAMIMNLNQQATDAGVTEEDVQAVSAEEQSDDVEAITEGEEALVEEDQGADQVTEVVAGDNDVSEELALLRKQAEQADQRWKVLQGMINKKDEEIDAMRSLLANMQAPAAGESSKSAPVKQLLTEDDVNEYGKDMIGMIQRASGDVINSRFNDMMKQVESRLSMLESNIGSVAESTKRVSYNTFESKMSELVPNWREVNVDPSFINWLESVDPFSGQRKLDLLGAAAQAEDANRAAAFFNTYLAQTRPAQVQPKNEAPAASKKDKLVAPGKANMSNATNASTRRTWTTAEISKLYDDKMAGKITAKQFKELERDLFMAQSEGRIAV
jgi:hypothetical protein